MHRAAVPRQLPVAVRDGTQFLRTNDIAQIAKWFVARAHVNFAQDYIGRVAAVRMDDFSRRREPLLLVRFEYVFDVAAGSKRRCQRMCVQYRLSSAVRATRIHWVSGIAEQRYSSLVPPRQRITIDHRKLEYGSGATY